MYGDHQGDWVDEETSPNNPSRKAAIRLEAEREWQALAAERRRTTIHSSSTATSPILDRDETTRRRSDLFSLNIFRLAGIYGPSRSAVDTVLKGEVEAAAAAAAGLFLSVNDHPGTATFTTEPLVSGEGAVAGKAPQPAALAQASAQVAWVSRVHVDDICGALLASMKHSPSPTKTTMERKLQRQGGGVTTAIFNVADFEPAPREKVLQCAAKLIAESRRPVVVVENTGNNERGSGPENTETTAAAAVVDTAVLFLDPGRQGAERRKRALRENKRVSGEKLRRELSYDFRYPTYESGLRSVLNLPTDK